MRNRAPVIYGILGGITYIINSALLPDWSHWLVGLLTGLVFVTVYWLLPQKQNTWKRILISIACTIGVGIAVAIARHFYM